MKIVKPSQCPKTGIHACVGQRKVMRIYGVVCASSDCADVQAQTQ